MNYRSKRTRAVMTKDDEPNMIKKSISAEATPTSTNNEKNLNWGPFSPGLGTALHHTSEKTVSGSTSEGLLKESCNFQQPKKSQHPSTKKASILNNEVTKTLQSTTASRKVDGSRLSSSESRNKVLKSGLFPSSADIGLHTTSEKVQIKFAGESPYMNQHLSTLNPSNQKNRASKSSITTGRVAITQRHPSCDPILNRGPFTPPNNIEPHLHSSKSREQVLKRGLLPSSVDKGLRTTSEKVQSTSAREGLYMNSNKPEQTQRYQHLSALHATNPKNQVSKTSITTSRLAVTERHPSCDQVLNSGPFSTPNDIGPHCTTDRVLNMSTREGLSMNSYMSEQPRKGQLPSTDSASKIEVSKMVNATTSTKVGVSVPHASASCNQALKRRPFSTLNDMDSHFNTNKCSNTSTREGHQKGILSKTFQGTTSKKVDVPQPQISRDTIPINSTSEMDASPQVHQATKSVPIWRNRLPSNSGPSAKMPSCASRPSIASPRPPLGADPQEMTQKAKNLGVAPEGVRPGDGGQADSHELEQFKPIRRCVLREWPDNIEFDEKEEVLAIDAEGKYQMVKESIHPHDIWHANGVKYFVNFNEFYQPLRKGGHVLIKFIGSVVKTERFCPIRETDWRHVNAQYKVDIIKLIRAHFVIPDGEIYDEGILKRTGRSVRLYRHYLKKVLFKPSSKTKEQIYQSAPCGHPRDSWIHLVDYWYSEKGKCLANCGKEARSSQNHIHTTGAKSYANLRADFEEKNKRNPSNLELVDQTHRKKDGTFAKDTVTEDFLEDVLVDIDARASSETNKSRVQLEDEALNKLMYGDETPERPLGYGYGVKQSDIFGVHGILKKEGFNYNENSTSTLRNMQNMEKAVIELTEKNKGLEKGNKELHVKFDKNNRLLTTVTSQIGHILDVLGSSKAPTEFLDIAKRIMHETSAQISESANGDGA